MLLQELVEQDFGITGRGKWLHSDSHDSLVVNSEDQTWFWNSKGIRGNIFDYLILVRGMTKEQAKNFLKNAIIPFSEKRDEFSKSVIYEKLVDTFWEFGKNCRKYWYDRCLKDETIDRRRLGYKDGWSIIPIYYENELVNFQMRRDEPEKAIKHWYRTNDVFLYNEEVLRFTKEVFITEGLVDCILLNQEGFVSVAASGVNTWKNDWFTKFINVPIIYYIEDNDRAGRIGAKNVANSLGVNKVRIVSFPDKKAKYDTGDYFKEGGTKESFREYAERNYRFIFQLG